MMSMQALDQPVALALSWMLTYLIHSTILVLSVVLVCRAIRPLAKRIGAGAENLAWKLALVGAFVSASVQVAAGVDPVLGALELEAGTQVVERAPAQSTDTRTRVLVRERVTTPVVIEDGEAAALGPVLAGPPVLPGSPTLELHNEPALQTQAAPLWPKLLVGAWLLGALIGLGRLRRSVVALRRKLADRSEVIDDPVLELFLTLCRDVDIRRKIRLTASPSINSPMALWRGEIVLPQRAIDELSPAAMRGVLAHELAHLERRDPHWLALAGVIEAVMFFQPLNRLARRGMQESAELLCDDWAIARTGDGVQFAKSLAELAAWTPAEPSSALVAAMVSERPLVRRVRRALEGDPRRFDEDEGPRPARMLLGLGTLAALCMVAPGAVNASPPEQVEDKRESKQAKKTERAQDKAAKAAAKAAEKAREARERAERAQREADEAQAAAERAQRSAERHAPAAPGGQHLIIRDGDEYLIIDGNGVRLHSDEADVTIIDGANPRMKLRVHDGDVDVDLDVDLDDLESIAEGLMGGLLGPGMDGVPVMPGVPALPGVAPVPGVPQTFGPGFDPEAFEQEMEAWAQEMEAWGEQFEQQFDADEFEQLDEEAIEREIEQRIRELEQLREQRRQRSKAPPAPPRAPAPPAPPAPAPTPTVAPLIPA